MLFFVEEFTKARAGNTVIELFPSINPQFSNQRISQLRLVVVTFNAVQSLA